MSYRIETEYCKQYLEITVSELIGQGWIPVGGISITHCGKVGEGWKTEGEDIVLYAQALTEKSA